MNYDQQNCTITSVLLFEDVRFESSGKEMLIGVYNDSIIVPQFPYVMARLAVRVALRLKKTPPTGTTVLQIVDPQGGILVNFGPVPIAPTDPKRSALTGWLGQIEFKTPGNYNVCFGVDEPPVPVFEFEVRTPIDPAEQARLD